VNEIDPSIPSLSGLLLPGGGMAALQRLAGAPGRADGPQGLQRAAKEFESILLQKVMEEMRGTVIDSGLLEDSTSKQFEGMFWDFLAQNVAEQGGLGLWKELYQQWSRQLPGADGPTSSLELLQ